MDGVGPAGCGDIEDALGVEVALGRLGWADEVGLIGVAHVPREAVDLRVDRDRRDPEVVQGAHDPQRNLTAVRDQNFLKHRSPSGRLPWTDQLSGLG